MTMAQLYSVAFQAIEAEFGDDSITPDMVTELAVQIDPHVLFALDHTENVTILFSDKSMTILSPHTLQ